MRRVLHNLVRAGVEAQVQAQVQARVQAGFTGSGRAGSSSIAVRARAGLLTSDHPAPRNTAHTAPTYSDTRASESYAIRHVTNARKTSATQLRAEPPGAGNEDAGSRPRPRRSGT